MVSALQNDWLSRCRSDPSPSIHCLRILRRIFSEIPQNTQDSKIYLRSKLREGQLIHLRKYSSTLSLIPLMNLPGGMLSSLLYRCRFSCRKPRFITIEDLIHWQDIFLSMKLLKCIKLCEDLLLGACSGSWQLKGHGQKHLQARVPLQKAKPQGFTGWLEFNDAIHFLALSRTCFTDSQTSAGDLPNTLLLSTLFHPSSNSTNFFFPPNREIPFYSLQVLFWFCSLPILFTRFINGGSVFNFSRCLSYFLFGFGCVQGIFS